MLTFGLTGGIACGKSTVSKTFRSHNIPIVDADIVARQVVECGTLGLYQIVEAFGNHYLQNDGTLNRMTLGQLAFSNKEVMDRLNSIMRPLIHNESDSQLKKLHDEGHPLIGYDAALICEHGNADKYRPLIVVSCPQDMQLERLMSRNSLSYNEAMNRINSQLSSEEKELMADFVIDSSMSIKHSIQQTEIVIYELNQILKVRNPD